LGCGRDGAAGDQRGAERAAFRPEHIGGLHRVGEGRELDRIVDKLDADEPAPPRQAHLIDALPMVEGEVRGGPRRVGGCVHDPRIGADGEHEARAEGMGRAEQFAEIDGLRSAFDADGEIAAGGSRLRFHGGFMP
jgi:hypothetical protein